MQRLFSWLTVSCYSFLIFIFSVLPIRTPYAKDLPHIDKVIHFATYALLSFIVLNLFILKRNRHPYIFCLSYSFFLGFFIECVQSFLPYRSFELTDLLVNALGAAAATPLRITWL